MEKRMKRRFSMELNGKLIDVVYSTKYSEAVAEYVVTASELETFSFKISPLNSHVFEVNDSAISLNKEQTEIAFRVKNDSEINKEFYEGVDTNY